MDDGVGARLREARTRRQISLETVEAETKIRSRYLRALENEEWDVLPGDTYARAFLRTYAGYLGLDGERLAEELRRGRGAARPGEGLPRVDAKPPRPARRPRPPGWRPSVPPRALAAIVSVALIAVLLIIGLSSGGGSGGQPQGAGKGKHRQGKQHDGSGAVAKSQPRGHTVMLTANAEVWVCLLNGKGESLVNGQILSAGAVEGPYRSGSFTVSLGNGEVTMTVDGQQTAIPPTSSPIGFEVVGGKLRELPEGERPTCT
jgi:cytoskeleton protein RodZ